MASVKRPSFVRSYSLGHVFSRRKRLPSYEAWVDCEADSLIEAATDSSAFPGGGGPRSLTLPLDRLHSVDIKVLGSKEDRSSFDGGGVGARDNDGIAVPLSPTEAGLTLADCFYLGSLEMSGMNIKGRGCIDQPAALIWERTQELPDDTRRRKNSLPNRNSKLNASGYSGKHPKYVKLVASNDELQVYDCFTNELMVEFEYRDISFIGTHPKYTRLFSFIAQAKGKRAPYCHAFKCEDEACAEGIACKLSDVFQSKAKSPVVSPVVIDSSATVLH